MSHLSPAMSGRILAALVMAFLVLATTSACVQQPASPSQIPMATTDASPAGIVSTSSQPGLLSGLRFGDRTPGVIFVTSQGLYYDTFVVKDPLPMHGRFQLLANGRTEFGPGQPGYLGGRWWEDVNGNGSQDPDDHYFLCPLLPPGRPTP